MSWISRWKIDDMIKWKGYHSLEERENYLLYRLESLEEKVAMLDGKQEILLEALNKIKKGRIKNVI